MLTLRPALLIAALLAPALAAAQTTYRWIDPASGSTVISDKPPPPGAKRVSRSAGAAPADEPALSYATRQAAEKFPVTLYTTPDCIDECGAARDLLNGRGIPFSERVLRSKEEAAELTRLLGSEAGIPSVGVGRQSFKGFNASAWNSLLDLAGYPKSAPYGARRAGTPAN